MGKIHQGDRIHNGWGKFWESTSVEKDETLCKSGNCRGVSAVWICLEKEGVDGSIRPGSAMIQLLSLPKPDGLGVVDNTADRGLALLYGYVKENWHRCIYDMFWWFRPTKWCCIGTHLSAANRCKKDQWCLITGFWQPDDLPSWKQNEFCFSFYLSISKTLEKQM